MSIAFFAAFFLIWEYSIVWFGIPRYILTPPSVVVTKGWADIDRLLYYTWITGVEVVLGYAVAVILALPLGLAIAFSTILRRTIYPFVVCVEMVPKIAFAPLFISWLGFGLLPKVIIVFLVCFFPIVLNAILAFSSLSEELSRFSVSTGASVWRTFVKVRLPAALPEEGEDIEVLEMPLDEALAGIADGRIVDAKTIILIQHLKLYPMKD